MRLFAAVLILLGFLMSDEAAAQSLKTAGTPVTFDPLFWKDELKITGEQYSAIQRINREYYEEIHELLRSHEGNIPYLQRATTELLQDRGEKIWSTFKPKQKRKWEKLSSAYAGDSGNSVFSSLDKARQTFN